MSEVGLVIPAHVVERVNARTETCGNCKWRHFGPETNGDVECRLHPPTTYLQPVPGGPPPRGIARPGQTMVQLQAFSVFAVVKDTYFCGQWAPKAGAVS